jgi:hypothetical protein
MKIKPEPGKGRRYPACTKPAGHGNTAGEACVACLRNYEDALHDHERWPQYHPEPVKRPRHTFAEDHPAFALMAAEAERHGWPEHYIADLTDHDRCTLAVKWKDHTAPFAWVLRNLGTHLVDPYPAPESNEPRQHFIRCARLGEIFSREHKYYVWDGSRLVECKTPSTADERLDNEARHWRRVSAEKAKATA